MRAGLLLLLLVGCGQPEDVLVIEGRVAGLDGGDPSGLPLTLFRDLGATELGCSQFSPWKQLVAGDGGTLRLETLRQETTGRFGLPRCLRLTWTDGTGTANLSWVGRTRDTKLPPLLTWFDAPGVTPALPSTGGGVTAQLPSYEVRDDRGVIFRQAAFTNPVPLLQGPGPAPALLSTLVGRATQRAQQAQENELGQDPLAQFEYRIETQTQAFTGNRALIELAKGSACNVPAPGSDGCALTDGLFEPVNVPAGEAELELPPGTVPRTIVVRGVGSADPYAALSVDGNAPDGGFFLGGRIAVDANTELLTTGTLEDPRPVAYVVVHWSGPVGPVTRLRVRLEDTTGARVPMNWAAEVSVY